MARYCVTLYVARLVNRRRNGDHLEMKRSLNVVAGSLALAVRKTLTAHEGYRPGGKGEKMTIEVERIG